MGTEKRRVCVVLVDRANYGRLKPVMTSIQKHPQLELQVIAAGTMVLERFHRPVEIVRSDGFTVNAEIFMELEGSVPATMAKSVGVGIMEFANELQRLAPDIMLLIGDRYEALSAALAAAYMNVPIVHVQGGEVSGSIDESARHAISKFSQFHVPATQRSAEYLIRMGEYPETILTVGCPSSDIAASLETALTAEVVNSRGNGCVIQVDRPFLLVVFHPTTTEFGDESAQMQTLLDALEEIGCQTILLWPNIDAGSDHISKMIRVFRDRRRASDWLRTRTNLTPEEYLKVLANATCAVGNSSSFVRDAGYFGTPVTLVGHRQDGRESDVHVMRVECTKHEVVSGIRKQIDHGRYAPSRLYGDGEVSDRIAEALVSLDPYVQKSLSYLGKYATSS